MTHLADKIESFGKVAVLMGGWAGEREISLLSGKAVLDGLLQASVNAVGVDVGRDICAVLAAGGFDRAFNVVHGAGGEDGVLQGVLDVLGLPYTGSGVAASALSMDKVMTKRVWASAGMPTPRFMRLTAETQWDAVIKALGLPLMVKPSCEGSSLGLAKVNTKQGLKAAWEAASEMAGDVFAEQFIEGREFTVGILNGEVLPVIELRPATEFYDYEAKYERDDTQYLCPCDLDPEEQQRMQMQALAAFKVLGANNWGRVDFMRDAAGKCWLIELNTVPGMTSHSLVPMAAKQHGLEFSELVTEILWGSLTLAEQASCSRGVTRG